MYIPDSLKEIAQELNLKGAKAILVGGAVRDFLLKKEVKDYDIEVYNIFTLDELESLLKPFGAVNQVGKAFGIIKLKVGKDEYDFSIPRREKKVGAGHKGFSVELDGSLSFKEASSRRDFTINSIGYDITSGEIIDPYSGVKDLENRVLRVVSAKTFTEDPLRVYRAAQFVARFNLELEESSFILCKEMVKRGDLDELPKERVYEEFKKLLLKSVKPSLGFELMLKLGIIERYFLELYNLTKTKQDRRWHPEGDVWIHTMMVLDKMANLSKEYSSSDRLILLFSALCHDLGKPATTIEDNSGKISAIGHEIEGLDISVKFIEKLTNEKGLIEEVLPLVKNHLQPFIYYKNGAKNSTIRKLATRVNIEKLILLSRADSLGRTTEDAIKGICKACDWLEEKAKELNVSDKPIEPILKGRDLINLGLEPSAKFKDILQRAYLAQLEEKFVTKDEGLNYLKELIREA